MEEFTGVSYEAAVLEAEKQLNHTSDALQIEVIEKGASGLFSKKPWRIAAKIKHLAAPKASDKPVFIEEDEDLFSGKGVSEGSFSVTYTEKGVMLAIDGDIMDLEIISYVIRRGIKGADLQTAKKLLGNGESPALLAPPQEEGPLARPEIYVSFSKDDMTATMRIFPGDPGAVMLSVEEAVLDLGIRYKIVQEIDIQKLQKILSQGIFRRDAVIAKGRLPVDGTHATLQFHFQQTHSMRPKILDGDRVDYRTLDIFETVKKGQVLVTRTPPAPGVDGQTLHGKVLKAKAGKDVQLPKGKGVEVSEDKLTLTALTQGMVTYVNKVVCVSSRYVIPGNVDMSIGNIDFTGDIEARGNIMQGMLIKATGAVEVHGAVEAATIVAGGDVVLRQGMQGMDKGEVQAGGDVVAKYFERTKVIARGVVTADAIYHSEINAVEGVVLAGKHASLVGGVTRSAQYVAARSIGSTSHTSTIVEVGILPEQRERYNFLELELRKLANENEQVSLLVRTFGVSAKEGEPPERDELRKRMLSSYKSITQQIALATSERNELKIAMESVTSGRVHVLGTIYPGAKVVIGSYIYVVESPIDYATFRIIEGEIVFRSCEYA